MKGTEKIIAHIQADAKAQADAILAQAEQNCASIRAAWEQKAKDAYAEKIRVGVKANQDRLDSMERLAKKPDDWSKGMILCITVEFYAILSLLASFMMLNGISL